MLSRQMNMQMTFWGDVVSLKYTFGMLQHMTGAIHGIHCYIGVKEIYTRLMMS